MLEDGEWRRGTDFPCLNALGAALVTSARPEHAVRVATSTAMALPPAPEFEKLLPRQASIADQRSQKTPTQFPVSRDRESPAGWPNQDHVTAFRAIEGESDPGDHLREVVPRENRKPPHGYARTSMI